MDTGASVRSNVIINRDCLAALKDMPDKSVDCCVTSPPYYGLRDYGVEGQIGREATPEQYVERLAEVFVQLYRVLSDRGTFWLNISDSYCGTGSKGACLDPKNPKGRNGQKVSLTQNVRGCKNKDMIGIPWLLAFALRDLGWYLRSDIIWQKGNAMPENVKDRPTRSYEHVFLFSKSSRYYYDASAIAEPIAPSTAARYMGGRSGSSKYSGTGEWKGTGNQQAEKSEGDKKRGYFPVQEQQGCVAGKHGSLQGSAFCGFSPKAGVKMYPCGMPGKWNSD